MNEFLRQCFRDLEAITGIRQLYYFETDPDGERKLDVCIKGILITCGQFPYIPEEAQKKIIREQMVKDQDFDALNSRTVWKWLDKAKDVWWAKSQEPVAEVKELEPLSEETQKLIREWQMEMIGSKTVTFKERLNQEMDKIKAEDKSRFEGKEMPKSDRSRKAWNVALEDAAGNPLGTVENVFAETQEAANRIVEGMVKRGEIKL